MRRSILLPLLAAACASGGRPATLETDGAWVRRYDAPAEAVYHAAVEAFSDRDWDIAQARPLSRSFQAKSPVRTSTVPLFGTRLRYRLARVDVEGGADGARLRLKVIRTHEPEGAGRRPNNDRAVEDADLYEALLDDVAARTKTP